jgi:hypothetical protein
MFPLEGWMEIKFDGLLILLADDEHQLFVSSRSSIPWPTNDRLACFIKKNNILCESSGAKMKSEKQFVWKRAQAENVNCYTFLHWSYEIRKISMPTFFGVFWVSVDQKRQTHIKACLISLFHFLLH